MQECSKASISNAVAHWHPQLVSKLVSAWAELQKHAFFDPLWKRQPWPELLREWLGNELEQALQDAVTRTVPDMLADDVACTIWALTSLHVAVEGELLKRWRHALIRSMPYMTGKHVCCVVSAIKSWLDCSRYNIDSRDITAGAGFAPPHIVKPACKSRGINHLQGAPAECMHAKSKYSKGVKRRCS
jgi:hypothetical protein